MKALFDLASNREVSNSSHNPAHRYSSPHDADVKHCSPKRPCEDSVMVRSWIAVLAVYSRVVKVEARSGHRVMQLYLHISEHAAATVKMTLEKMKVK